MVDPPRGSHAKKFGAYYTDQRVADFLVHWAVRSASDRVIDPSFGGGVFLNAAIGRLEQLGGDISQVRGVELDEQVHGQIAYELSLLYGLDSSNLRRANFFEVTPERFTLMDAVVGNPPFIRYQSFNGADRQLALRRAEKQGVKLSSLVSSWAPFLVHSCALLKPGGRLAMVIPLELGHAAYARPVLDYLVKTFECTTLLTFKERLFPELSQDTLLVLAEGKGKASGNLRVHDLSSVGDLEDTNKVIKKLARAEQINSADISSGRTTLASYWLSKEARNLYERLSECLATKRLGEFAEVSIGYVTGANAFFHLNKTEAKVRGISGSYLSPAIYRGRALGGLQFSKQDWQAAEQAGEAGYLLHLPPEKRLSKPVKTYLAEGESRGVQKAYKCRIRSPWYSVPHVYKPDAFLTYMSGLRPLLIANDAGAVTPNSLHAVRLRSGALTARDLALLWQTSLTSLSVELEGHALGGGMLKLEPREARNVLLAVPEADALDPTLFERVDTLLREGDGEGARALVDKAVLGSLGLGTKEIDLLRESAAQLRDRRYYAYRRRKS